jgi:hypothetical protein
LLPNVVNDPETAFSEMTIFRLKDFFLLLKHSYISLLIINFLGLYLYSSQRQNLTPLLMIEVVKGTVRLSSTEETQTHFSFCTTLSITTLRLEDPVAYPDQ